MPAGIAKSGALVSLAVSRWPCMVSSHAADPRADMALLRKAFRDPWDPPDLIHPDAMIRIALHRTTTAMQRRHRPTQTTG